MTSDITTRQASDLCAGAAALLDLLDIGVDRDLAPVHWTLSVDALTGGAVLAGLVVGAGAPAAQQLFEDWCEAAEIPRTGIIRPGDYPASSADNVLVAVTEKPGGVTLILEASP